MTPQLDLFATVQDGEYDRAFILDNPIPALCTKGKSPWCRNKPEDIHAPVLENVRCFWCGSRMRPCDPDAYQARLATLAQYWRSAP